VLLTGRKRKFEPEKEGRRTSGWMTEAPDQPKKDKNILDKSGAKTILILSLKRFQEEMDERKKDENKRDKYGKVTRRPVQDSGKHESS